MANAYTLKEKGNTKEYHLFKGAMNSNNIGCTSGSRSICTKMNSSESIGNIFSCLNENEARRRCAEIGREVCGTCVSDLYKTY